MKVAYFPGCTLKTKAKELDKYTRATAEALGVSLEEIDNWQCCGGVFTTARDEIATKLSSVRALLAAKEKDQILVSVCSACHNVIKQTNHAIQTDEEFATRVNNYIDVEYNGETNVMHYLELLRDVVGFDKVAEKIYNYDEVKSLYLMSGAYDLAVFIEGKTMKQVALFVAEKLATIENVMSTSTHFVLRKYKNNGVSFGMGDDDTVDERGNIN